ncbi:hypothetical protein ABEF95_002964 [Exophiala dermatitidis]
MAGTKRPSSNQPPTRPTKRIRRTVMSASGLGQSTSAAFEQFQDQTQSHAISLSPEQFTGLCAYLDVILQWGYQIDETAYDRFILRYPDYNAALPQLQQRAKTITTARAQIPSYHVWFQQQNHDSDTVTSADPDPADQLEGSSSSILTRAVLDDVVRENRYTHLRTRLTLEAIMKKGMDGEARQAFATGLRQLEARLANSDSPGTGTSESVEETESSTEREQTAIE